MPFIQLQFRRDTSTNWANSNPILANGEMAIETDSHQFKIGNGCSPWLNLPYGGIRGVQGPQGPASGGGGGGGAQGATGPAGSNGGAGPQGAQGPSGGGGGSSTKLTAISVKADPANPGGITATDSVMTTQGSNVASMTITANSIQITFTSAYTAPNFPIFTGTVYWYNGTPGKYSIIQIPSSTNVLEGSGVLNLSYSGTTLTIVNIDASGFPSITNDSTSGAFGLYLFLEVFN